MARNGWLNRRTYFDEALNTTVRECAKCGCVKVLEEFSLARGCQLGRRFECKSCAAKKCSRNHYEKRYYLNTKFGMTFADFEAMREAALISQKDFADLSRSARESVSAHTLENGAVRFVNFAQEAIAGWQ